MRAQRRLWFAVAAMPMAVLTFILGVPLLAISGFSNPPSVLAGSVAGIPARVLQAYRAADAWCPGLRWQLLASIGAMESGHGTTGGATADPDTGEVTPWIFGPPLDGSPGVQALPIGQWLGWWGLTGPWQQAVGPMQFLPGTFTAWAVDHDGDGVANPHDIDDAVTSAANYLCGGKDGSITDEHAAVMRYNHSEAYATRVIDYANQIAAAADISIVCPVAGPNHFTNTWLAPRPGGRQHQGVDIFADEGTPVVAPVAGEVQLGDDALGGHAFRLWGDDGNYYYGAHLMSYAEVSGHVEAGTVVGYVGHTGDAANTPPHLHFEIHPGRRKGDPPNATDPTESVARACYRADPQE